MDTIKKLYDHFLNSAGVSTDSRNIGKDQIFFAIRGENFDGNEYAQMAVNKGAKIAVVDRPGIVADDKFFRVENSLETLQELARYHRQKLDIPVIGITGSNGKTTTKELIHGVLTQKYRTLATQGNLNNHIGVPLSLLKIRNEEMAIIEMGANHPGEIDFLSRISQPDYGIITNIGKAHLEGFGSFEGVKKTKSELYRYLDEKEGTIFINGNNPILMEVSQLDRLNKVFYMGGEQPVCDGYIIESKEKLKIHIKFNLNNSSVEALINLTGSYNLENVLAAACIGYFFKITPEEIKKGLESFKSTVNRSQYIKTDKNLVISDAYNANPTSMLEAIRNFSKMEADRKVLILGDMLELGPYSDTEHQNIITEIQSAGYKDVYLVGEEFGKLRDSSDYHFFDRVHDLYEHFRQKPVNDSLILLKGSRGIALEKIIGIL